ncbi:MAG: acylphosphatase [Chloroflexi bacterium]|nr:acylphosphatase [Chloroflexota bacterium]
MDAQSTAEVRAHAFVHGRVQGVGFRNFVLQTARRLGLKGWARNRINGTVEVVAQGPKPAVEALLKALERGPALAYVTQVEVSWETPQPNEQTPFSLRATR